MPIVVRAAEDRDAAAIHGLHASCFPTDAEARLVAALGAADALGVSLVAVDGDAVIGHVAFSRMAVMADARRLAGVALAPVAVAANVRERGIASTLIERGLADAEDAGARIAFVLGDPDFYERFGFDAALGSRFASPYAGPAWQAVWLGAELRVNAGTAHHHAAFAALDGS